MVTKVLRCYAHGHDGNWEGICVDLDIAVTGTSFRDVRDRLDSAISTYVADALNEDPQVAHHLLARRAPIWIRTSYAVRAWVSRWFSSRNDNDTYAGFDVPCHA